jgi:hypothetical protein
MQFAMGAPPSRVAHRTPRVSVVSKFLDDRAEFLVHRLGHGFGPMSRQNIAQVCVDPFDQILVGSSNSL